MLFVFFFFLKKFCKLLVLFIFFLFLVVRVYNVFFSNFGGKYVVFILNIGLGGELKILFLNILICKKILIDEVLDYCLMKRIVF